MRERVLLLVALSAAAGCNHRAAQRGAATAATADTLSGVIAVTGTSFAQRLVLRHGNSAIALLAEPSDSAALSRLGGVEVQVLGKAEGSGFRAASFMATRVEGAPVVDGVLRRDGDHLVLETARGRIALGNPPAAFRSMLGARVWVAGPLDAGPNSYGVIVPARPD
ncbi:MAG: hypothetical protein ACHQQ3_12295 [Gemmatimonadales bacterium]